ncbi:MAG: outer membrane porin GjpA [Mycobacterium sp.]
MRVGLGPLAATGVAIVSAGAIAIIPVSPPLPDVVEPAVELTADTDWSVIFSKAGQNAGSLTNSYFDPLFPVLQQIIVNQIGYLGDLPDIPAIAEQIVINIARGVTAPAAPTTDTLDAQHTFLYNALPVITSIPFAELFFQISPTGQQLLDFSTSPVSGVLLGLVGPGVGPAVVLGSNLQSIVNDLTAETPDAARALATLLNTPAQMTDAFLNGGVHVDITELAEALGPSFGVSFPKGTKVGVAFGGLFSPGGSVFNALDMDYDRDIFDLPIIRFNLANGQGPGFFGSLIDMHQTIAKAIGWNGTGNPLAPAESDSGRSSLAPVDEVPRSVLGERVSSVTTPVAETDTTAAESKATAADLKSKVAVDPTPSVVESGEAAPDREPVLSKGIRASKAFSDEDTTSSEGGRHRASSDRSTVEETDSGVTSGKPGRHAKADDDTDSGKSTKADRPAKSERSAKAAAKSGGSDSE